MHSRTCLLVALAAVVVLLAVPASAAASDSSALGRIRRALNAVQATGEGLEQLFPALSETSGRLLYEASHLPGRLLMGATARGTRATPEAPQMPDASPERDPSHRDREMYRLINGAVKWYQGHEEQSNTAAAPGATQQESDDHPGVVDHASIDALSRIHLRAAEAAAEAKRSARAFASQQAAMSDTDRAAAEAVSVAHAYAYDIAGDESEVRSAMQTRSERRLVDLLRWRREQREHHQRPHIRPEYLPHYAKRFSGHPEANAAGEGAKRTFQAQQAFQRPTYQYCHDGIAAIPGSVNFTCNTSSGGQVNRTAVQVAAEPPEVRANCTPKSSRRACLCPRDSVPGRTVFGDVVCFWRQIKCTVERVSPAQCPEQPIDEPKRIQQCVTVSRSATIAVAINVSCEYAWADPRDYAFFGIDLLPIPPEDVPDPETFLVLNTTNTTQDIVVNLTNSRFAAYGTYEQVVNAVFIYTAEPATSIMPLTPVHPIVGSAEFFMRPINFNRLSDRTHQTGWIVGEQGYTAGQLTGQKLASFRIDLDNVSASYVHGNRMFLEAGIRGGLLPVSVIAAPFTIDFNDLPVPPLRSESDNTTTIIVVAVVVPVVVIAAIVAGICAWRWHTQKKRREKREDKED